MDWAKVPANKAKEAIISEKTKNAKASVKNERKVENAATE